MMIGCFVEETPRRASGGACRAKSVRAAALAGVLATVCAIVPGVAAAAAYVVDPSRSQIDFDYERAGTAAHGMFARFAAAGTFDPGHPDRATLDLRIESASIDLGEPLASAFATSAEWFDSRNNPDVSYDLVSLSPSGTGIYRARGTITIRGVSRPLESDIAVRVDADEAEVTGSFDLRRGDFGLGLGPSAAFVTIGPMVSVRFDLVARRTDTPGQTAVGVRRE